MGKLDNKVALVTGAASGIGYGVTKVFTQEGAKVIASDINDNVENLVNDFGDAVLPVKSDVSDEESVKSMIQQGIDHFGQIDILVNNAGVSMSIDRLHELETERFRKTIDINLMGQFFTSKHIIPHFLEKGKGNIINMASISAFPPFTAAADYTASKAAVKRLTESIAYEYGVDNIRANAIAPGHIDTPIYDGIEDHKTKMAEKIPVKRFGEPEEIAKVAVSLATDDFSYVTGQTITVDGGRLLN